MNERLALNCCCLFVQDIAEMFVTVGMCEEAVSAYVKVGIYNELSTILPAYFVALCTMAIPAFETVNFKPVQLYS